MVAKSEEAQAHWGELKNLASQKNHKRVGDHELSWDQSITGTPVLVLNSVAASFCDGPKQIRFSIAPALKSLSPSIHVEIGKQPNPVTWSVQPSNKAGRFAWAVDDEFGGQKKLTTAELSDAIETKLANYPN